MKENGPDFFKSPEPARSIEPGGACAQLDESQNRVDGRGWDLCDAAQFLDRGNERVNLHGAALIQPTSSSFTISGVDDETAQETELVAAYDFGLR